MPDNRQTNQLSLFDFDEKKIETEKILLYALGEFQSRGKILAGRKLALDRLRGAFKRASEKFGVAEFSDEKIAESLEKLGAKIVKVQLFVAKHPFRVTVPYDLAEKAKQNFQETSKDD